jgi:hypothetical protein
MASILNEYLTKRIRFTISNRHVEILIVSYLLYVYYIVFLNI